MSIWEAVLLGLVQGATEFLPVSSSGHLVMGQELLGVRLPGVLFEVAVHVATLLSVLFVYRRRVARLVTRSFGRDADALRYVGLLVVATLPVVVVGAGFRGFFEALFDLPEVTGAALLVTGALLWSVRGIRRVEPAAQGTGAVGEPPGLGAALAMGVAQAAAVTPGLSRSGATVVVGLWLGVPAREAAAFSFLMSVPAIAGAGVLTVTGAEAWGGQVGAAVLIGGGLTAGLAGIAAIRVFLRLLERHAFHRFALYCWVVGGAFLGYLFLR